MPTAPLSAERLAALDDYCARFRPVFPRADQYRRFRAYLLGLLAAGDRRNVEAIAAAARDYLPAEPDLVQALQHFVSRSPWEANHLFAAYRAGLPAGGAWVIHDAAFPKKGRHSAGVQRQFARTLGRKVNCQVAVVVSRVGPEGAAPLAARLYLPAAWLRDGAEQAEKTVPAEHRRAATKGEIALALLDELAAEGLAPARGAVVAEEGYRGAPELLTGLPARGLALAAGDAELPAARARFDALRAEYGAGHFEGRTWAGWHHHLALVFAAAAFGE